MIEFLSIVVFTFALTLFGLGIVTRWIERGPKRRWGLGMMAAALFIATGYAFLGSRFAIALFGRLIVRVDLPRLMVHAVTYTVGVLTGFALAGGIFLWASGRILRPSRRSQFIVLFLGLVLAVGLALSLLAVRLSR